jgi:asparagine synthase (glutamine-hydrolysing)
MSFVVVFNTDGTPLDGDLLRHRYPKIAAKNIQIVGRGRQVALIPAHSGPPEDATEQATLEGSAWLIGRVRLDGRKQLQSIISGSRGGFEEQCDALICLSAYARWGERCLDQLRGDFCFVIWDEDRQKLFCGRDQLGVRPLFYAKRGNSWLLSDSLDLIRPPVFTDDDLDDYWIADFLINGFCGDFDRTVYKEIKRLQPAHFLRIRTQDSIIQKYWTLGINHPLYYTDSRNYIEHFQEVVTVAVKDRLSKNRVGISLSGGLDSSTLAAHALAAGSDASKIVAFTRHFERLIPDQEKHFSSLVADRLGIRLTLRTMDDAWYDPHWYDRDFRTPEPNTAIVQASQERIIAAEMAELAQVWFCGDGPDNALAFEWQSYLRWLFHKGDWLRLGGTIIQYFRGKQAREWYCTFSNSLKRRPASDGMAPALPSWMNDGLLQKLQLVPRSRQESSYNKHPWHPMAVASFNSAIWQHFFEQCDPAILGSQLTWRYPYLDLRVLIFLLSVPPIPWARRKRLIREAMRGLLPEQVLSRQKTPLFRNPMAILIEEHGLPKSALDGPILRYIDRAKIPNKLPNDSVVPPLIRVYVLNAWLNSRRSTFAS